MRISTEEFLPFAPEDVGSVRVNHVSPVCSGDSKSMRVTRTEDGIVYAKCFRCNGVGRYVDSHSVYGKVKKEIKRRNEPAIAKVNKLTLPSDMEMDPRKWPAIVKVKVGQYLVTDTELKNFGIGWSEKLNRLIFPVSHGADLVGWQGRYYGKDESQPKYITRYKDTGDLYVYIPFLKPSLSSDACVVVEDFFSAIRCSRYTNALALLGSNMGDAACVRVSRGNRKALIFLDDDTRQVRLNQLKIKQQLTQVGVCATIITGVGKDPKELKEEELRDLITDSLSKLT